MSADVTKIELAKALKAIKAISTDEQFEQVKKIYIQPGGEDSVLSAVNGLSEEDEFALLTKLLQTTTHIIGFEQRPLVEGDYTVPDFYVSFKPGCAVHGKKSSEFTEFKCLIDVKSTQKDTFKISGGKLRKLRNFADLQGLRLFFAVRFLRFNQSALWAIVEDADRSSTFLHVNYENVVDGLRHVLWNEYVLTPNPRLNVICRFSKSSNLGSVTHPVFGEQIGVDFTDGQNILWTVNGPASIIPCSLMESYNLEEFKVEVVDKDITLQYLRPTLVSAFLADLIYKINNLPIDEFGRVTYDASKLIVRSDTGAHDALIDRTKLELIAKPLIDNNVLFVGGIKSLEEHLLLWQSFGGNAS